MGNSRPATDAPVKASLDNGDVKTCCALAYSSVLAKLLLGDSFHPGGIALTKRTGMLIGLQPDDLVLDIASGNGTSALCLARRFGCRVVGVDYSPDLVRVANEAAERAESDGLSQLVTFQEGDAEGLPFESSSFTAVVCECAFCTFPNKTVAASELARVLVEGGRLGLSDLTRTGDVPPELQSLLGWIACIADAQPLDSYRRYLEEAGLRVEEVEQHDYALQGMVRDIRDKLLGAELLVKLGKLSVPGGDLSEAQALARAASEAISDGRFGYTLLTGRKVRKL
jgi:ubiquinone/menaquinone biosynthesis C-methylase UbiE